MIHKRTKRIAMCGVLTTLAMIFSYIESIIPIPLPVPGIKLGVANIAVVSVLYTVGAKEAFIVNIIRITLTALLFGNLNSFIFSICGGGLSIIVMIILKKIDILTVTGVSVAGGIMHNIGQTLAAIWIMGSSAIALYLPVLLISGVITGVVIGIVAGMVMKRIVVC